LTNCGQIEDKVKYSFKNTFKGLNLENMKGERGDLLPKIQAMVEEEEGTTMMVGKCVINSYKGNLHQSKFESSKGRMIQTSTLDESKKWTKSLTFI